MKTFTYAKEDQGLTREELNKKYENNILYWKDLCEIYGEGREFYKGQYDNRWDLKMDFGIVEKEMPRLQEFVDRQNKYYQELPCIHESSKHPDDKWIDMRLLLTDALDMGVRGVLGELTDDDLDYNDESSWKNDIEGWA